MKAFLVAMVVVSACQPTETKVGKARLAEADGTISAPKGPVVEVPGAAPAASYAGPVRVAPDRDATYQQVLDVAAAVKKAGGEPFLLVAHNDSLYALPAADPVEPNSIKLVAHAGDVKACISPPDVQEATCVARKDHLHIDRAFVREIVRQAVNQYHLRAVHVVLDPQLSWADAIRAIDGARTCCFETKVTVSVEP